MDARVAFDDVLGDDETDLIGLGRKALRVLKGRRLKTPTPRVQVVGFDSTAWTFEPPSNTVVGADSGIVKGIAAMYDKLRDRFRAAIGKPKLVRLDNEATYAEFRDLRRQSHLDCLNTRLEQLEQMFARHTSDGHDSEYVPEGYDEAYIAVIRNAARGGKPVNLGLPPHMRAKVECWLDGDEVLLSVRLSNGIATTGAMLDGYFEEVVGCAEIVGCCGTEALVVGTQLAPAHAGLRLLGELCQVAPALAKARQPLVGVVTPTADPGFAAMMALLQRCQRGDKQALREAEKLATGAGYNLVCEAGERLTLAQEKKARKQKRVVGMDAREFGINFYGGAHTGGKILMNAFGAGAVVDMLDPVTKPALPGWAGGTADAKPEVPMPPPAAPKNPPPAITAVSAPDAVVIVHKNGINDVITFPKSVGVLGGVPFKGNGYVKGGDPNKFSFGFEAPQSVTVILKNGKKNTDADVKGVMFQGGKPTSVNL